MITFRNQKWEITRDGVISEEGRTYLNQQLTVQNSCIEELIETLQRLPLALYQAVSYINNKHSDSKDFGKEYKIILRNLEKKTENC